MRARQASNGSKYRSSYIETKSYPSAIDHTFRKTGVPVRSPVLKPMRDRLVVGSVTTSEYLLLIVLLFGLFMPQPIFARSVGFASHARWSKVSEDSTSVRVYAEQRKHRPSRKTR